MSKDEDKIDLRPIWREMKKRWYLYLLSFIAFMGLAITYCIVRMPQYYVHSAIMIEEDKDGGESSMLSAAGGGMAQIMRNFSIGGIGALSVDNECVIFNTHDLMKQTMSRLELNRVYLETSFLSKKLLYKESPIIVDAPKEYFDTLSMGFKLQIHLHDGKVDVKAVKGLFNKVFAEKTNQTLPFALKTPYGNFQILKTKYYSPNADRDILVNVSGDDIMAEAYKKLVLVDYVTKKADGVSLDVKSPDRQLGKDVLNTMMAVYNEIRLNRKNEKAKRQVEFYDEQISEISKSLYDAEKNVETFKKSNNFVDLKMEAQSAFGTNVQTEKKIIELNNQIVMYDMVLKLLNDPTKKYTLLPIDGELDVVRHYNELLMKKIDLDRSAYDDNAAQKALNEKIDAMRSMAKEVVERMKKNTQVVLASVNAQHGKSSDDMAKLPVYERQYTDMLRDKELKNSLYIFLLEKRSNSAMTLATNFPQGFIVEKAYCDSKPLKTKSYIALGAGLFLSLFVPTVMALGLYKINRMRRKEKKANAEE